MAILLSEDQEWTSSLAMTCGERRSVEGQDWREFKLTLTSGEQTISLGNDAGGEEKEGCLLCLSPDNEVARLVKLLEELAARRRDRVLFEPAEPSFELEIARSGPDGLKVYIWIDSGNAKTGIYRWDAAGIRFFTLQEHLVSFLQELKDQFAC